ncbi:MAG TPA: molybdenum cofactor biosynthesis protein MoaE [Longimicrobiales bacterium]|nr:molybdenum cofactor biosynthesis protein MoaE [Longimicrobiales bacterium]
MIFTDVTAEPIDPGDVLARVGAHEDGAVLLFLGVVRNHAEGRPVAGMRYDAYEEMARSVLAEIAREASERHGTERIAVVHRVGDLKLGETSVAIAVSTPHRAEAYAANREIIEEIKQRLPVWKNEQYLDGASTWVDGVTPPVPDHAGGAA